MTEETKLPKYLYKYRSWSDPLHRRIITHREIWFASPRSFNDPFDCRIITRCSECDRDHIIDKYTKYFQNTGTDEEKVDPQKFAILEADRMISMTDAENEIMASKVISQFGAITGIFTASSKFDDILMWSHYSSSHSGFCVEIDVEKLLEFTDSQLNESGLAILPYEVVYEDTYPTLLRLPGSEREEWMRQYVVKAENWKYESEYRLMNLKKTDFSILMNPGIISKVILGCQMPDSDQEAIIHELLKQGGEIALERAVKLKDKFGLKFEPVEY